MTDFSKKFRQVNYAYAHKNNSGGELAPKNDIGYGPWPSKEEAWSAILSIFGASDETTESDDTTSGRINIPIGIIAGVAEFENGVIKTDSDIKEYQLKGGHKYVNFNEYNNGETYNASNGIRSDSFENNDIEVDFGEDQDTILSDIGVGTSSSSTTVVTSDTTYELNCTSDQTHHCNIYVDERNGVKGIYSANSDSLAVGTYIATVTWEVNGVSKSGVLSVCSTDENTASSVPSHKAWLSLGQPTDTISNVIVTPNSTTSSWGFVINDDGSRSIVSLQKYSE